VTDDELRALFAPHGEVVEVHRLNKPGQPVGALPIRPSRLALRMERPCMGCLRKERLQRQQRRLRLRLRPPGGPP
jgi:hypothetical protein